MAVNLQTSVNNVGNARFVGMTVGQLRADRLVRDALSLEGNEVTQARTGNEPWRNVDDRYVVVDGETVSFSLAVGQKG